METKVQITLEPEAQPPTYATAGAAGMDVRTLNDIEIRPMERLLVPTGIRMAVPVGYEIQVRPRSGLALKHGIALVNSPGTIDSDFRGEIGVILINFGETVVKLLKGERIAQLVLAEVARADIEVVDSLEMTERGQGGFGSTGTQ